MKVTLSDWLSGWQSTKPLSSFFILYYFLSLSLLPDFLPTPKRGLSFVFVETFLSIHPPTHSDCSSSGSLNLIWPQFNSGFYYLSLPSSLLQGKSTVPVDQVTIWNHSLWVSFSTIHTNPSSSAFWMSPYIRPFTSSCFGSCSVTFTLIATWLLSLTAPPPKKNPKLVTQLPLLSTHTSIIRKAG